MKHDVDNFAEKRLLNTIVYQPEFIDEVTEELFSSSSTRNVYKAIINLRNSNVPVTRDALLQAYSQIDLDASPTIIDIVCTQQNDKLTSISDIILQLKDAKKRRKILTHLKAAEKKISETTVLNEVSINEIKDIISAAEEPLVLDTHNTKKVMNFEEWGNDYNKELNIRKKGKQYYFYNFVFDQLIPDGPRPGEIGIISSAAGSGKSSLCLSLINSLIDAQIPCMYFSLEMSSIATMDRLMSRRLEIKYADIVTPKDQGQYDDLCDLINNERNSLINNKKFRFSEDASMSLNDLKKHIKKFQAEMGQTYCIVVLDLLSMITDFTKVQNGVNFAQSIEVSINKLSAISKELNVHIVGVLQLNRSTESDAKINDVKDLQKFKPNRAAIKNAGAWIERCRWAITTFREKMYAEMYLPPELYDTMVDIMEVQLVKCNNSRIGKTVRALFNGEYFTIEPIMESAAELALQANP